MRTTIDLPDTVFRRAKREALDRGCTLKAFVTDAVRHALDQPVQVSVRTRRSLPRLVLPADAPIRTMTHRELAEADAEAEGERHDEVHR
jgi:hypothetical protein